MTIKHCPQCNLDLSDIHFAACHTRSDELARTCRHCDAERRHKNASHSGDSARRAQKRWSLGHFAEPTLEMVR